MGKSKLLDGEGRKIYRKFLILMFCFGLVGLGGSYLFSIHNNIPSSILLRKGEVEEFDFGVPCVATIGDQQISLSKSFSVQGSQQGNYEMKVDLFGFIPFKKLEVQTVETTKLIPGGENIGVYVETDGIMVLGTTSVKNEKGQAFEPAKNIVTSGDYIVAANGKKMHYKSEFLAFVKENKTKPIILTLRRNDVDIKVRITPVEVANGEYKCGIWIRDDTQGIGTITYCDEDGNFGALGHGISDVDTGELLKSKKGSIYQSLIAYVVPSSEGDPGELVGSIDYAETYKIGDITENTEWGIFGKGNQKLTDYVKGEALPVGLKQEIELGKAYIVTTISGEKKQYEIEIEKCNLADTKNKGMVIRVTDKELLKITGGIVQGLSGSPIIQNGKIIGAVTHVFVNDPTKGYAVFIENMLKH